MKPKLTCAGVTLFLFLFSSFSYQRQLLCRRWNLGPSILEGFLLDTGDCYLEGVLCKVLKLHPLRQWFDFFCSLHGKGNNIKADPSLHPCQVWTAKIFIADNWQHCNGTLRDLSQTPFPMPWAYLAPLVCQALGWPWTQQDLEGPVSRTMEPYLGADGLWNTSLSFVFWDVINPLGSYVWKLVIIVEWLILRNNKMIQLLFSQKTRFSA